MSDRLIRVAGHRKEFLSASPGPSWFGNIRDGVSFAHTGLVAGSSDGGWVISFEDLESLYFAARDARGLPALSAHNTESDSVNT